MYVVETTVQVNCYSCCFYYSSEVVFNECLYCVHNIVSICIMRLSPKVLPYNRSSFFFVFFVSIQRAEKGFFLIPPSLATGTEIVFRPRRERNLSIIRRFAMGEGERKGGGSSNDVPIRRILRSVARAHELVVGSRPWDDATQVSAHSVQTEAFDRVVVLHNDVGS